MKEDSERTVCAYPWQQMVIDLTGEVVPCCFWSGYGNTGKPLGNTNEKSIDEIWNGRAYRKLRAHCASGKLKGTPCHECVAYRWSGNEYPRFSWPVEYKREKGHCFTTSLPSEAREASLGGEEVILCEDGKPLPYPEAVHDEIRAEGEGRYSVWGETLYFSTTDGSDPTTSGRRYELRFGTTRIKLAGLVRESTSGKNLLLAYAEYGKGMERVQARPSMISFISTADCNIDCPSCSQNLVRLLRVQHREQTEPDVVAHIPYLHQLIWHGGEPFLIKRFREFIDEFQHSDNPNLTFGFTTNGTMLDRDTLDKLEKFPFINASISIDSFREETFSVVRAGADFDRVLRNTLAAVARYRAPDRVFSVGMIILKSNFLELPFNLQFAFENDIGLNLSPVVVTPVHERLDVFQNFSVQTRGWQEALAEAREVLERARVEGRAALARVDPAGMLDVLDDLLDEARRRYADPVTLRIEVSDPRGRLPQMRNPGIIVWFTQAPEKPLAYAAFSGEGRYELGLPRAELSGERDLQWFLVHDLDESMGILDADEFLDQRHQPLRTKGWREISRELRLEIPDFTPPLRARRNILISNQGMSTSEGLHALGPKDLYNAYVKLMSREAQAGFGLAGAKNPITTIKKRAYKKRSYRYFDFQDIGG